MRCLSIAVLLAATGCYQMEAPPPPAWALAPAGHAGIANLDNGCIGEFDPQLDYFPDKVTFEHSAQLAVEYHPSYKELVFTPAVDNKEQLRYALVQCGAPPPPGYPAARVIEVPIRRFTTENHSILSSVTLLGITDRLAGVASRYTITEPTIRELVLSRELAEVGGGTHSDIELAMAVAPDVHFTFYSVYPTWNLHPKLWELGVTAVPMADHMDTTPLGRAEWVKLLSLFVNREAQANEWFRGVAGQYEQLSALTADVTHRPRVLYGTPDTRGSWELRGDTNHFARLIHDAGGEYFWERGGASSWEHAPYEEALYGSATTMLWIGGMGLTGIDSIDQLLAKDSRFEWLRPVRMERVHALDRGGAGAWTAPWTDQSMDKPHRLLADLIRVLHPSIAVEHKEMFLRTLEGRSGV